MKLKFKKSHLQKLNYTIGSDSPLFLIAGPCQLESKEHSEFICEKILEVVRDLPINFVFKGSFDKANRTSLSGKRGLGIDEGLKILDHISTKYSVPVITDIHDVAQVKIVSEAVDVLQIPAFLCRQTDLLIEAGKHATCINVKKGQFLAPEDMKFAADKILSSNKEAAVFLCERGTSFGYRDLIVDLRSLVIMKELGFPVIFDATHSVQTIGGAGDGVSSGNRKFILPLIKGAIATGAVDGLFIETHEDPIRAPSDAMSMLPLKELKETLSVACRLRTI